MDGKVRGVSFLVQGLGKGEDDDKGGSDACKEVKKQENRKPSGGITASSVYLHSSNLVSKNSKSKRRS